MSNTHISKLNHHDVKLHIDQTDINLKLHLSIFVILKMALAFLPNLVENKTELKETPKSADVALCLPDV